MAKTMRNIVIACIALILVAAGLVALVVFGGFGKTASDPFSEQRAAVINTVLDTSGVKSRIDSELRSHATQFANEIGVSPAVAESLIDTLAVEDWKAVPLPDNVTVTANFTVDIDETPVEVTTYDDISIVTLEAYGQEVTFEVPESAQDYMTYLPYLQYVV